MECCLHACDVSQQTRSFKVVKEWTYLLFEEFFAQGDTEKELGLPISMLCDRSTTKVAASQPGFISFVSLPMIKAVSAILPKLREEAIPNLKKNKETWADYQETPEDEQVYKKDENKHYSDELESYFPRFHLSDKLMKEEVLGEVVMDKLGRISASNLD